MYNTKENLFYYVSICSQSFVLTFAVTLYLLQSYYNSLYKKTPFELLYRRFSHKFGSFTQLNTELMCWMVKAIIGNCCIGICWKTCSLGSHAQWRRGSQKSFEHS